MSSDTWTKQKTWGERYAEWQARATEQAREMYPSGHLEVCEDGSVYLGNLAWLPKGTVEAWSDA